MQRADAARTLEELEVAYYAGLEGWSVATTGASGVVVEHVRGAPFVRYKTENGEEKLLRPRQVLPALIAWQREHGVVTRGKSVPEDVTKLAVMLFKAAQRLQSIRDPVAAWREKRNAKREALQEKRRKCMGDIGDHRVQLDSFDRQAAYLDKIETEEEEIATALESHELHDTLQPFVTMTTLVTYFRDELGMPITRQSVYRRLAGPVREQRGGPTSLSKAQEDDLSKHIVLMAKRGQVLSQKDVRMLAAELKHDMEGVEMMSMNWYKTFLKRTGGKFNLRTIAVSTLSTTCIANFNTVYLNWWYDATKSSLKGLGVVEDPGTITDGDNDDAGGEVVWLFPERVLVIDETHVVSRESSQSRKPAMKDYAPADLQASMQRMRTVAPKDEDTHVTLLTGMNLSYETCPPLWILSNEGPRKAAQERMNEIISEYCTSSQLGKFNGREYPGSDLAWSTNGSMTKDNFLPSILKMLEPVFPDMSDIDPSKRVILFMDGRSSFQHNEAMSELAQRGVYLHYWLPRTTSQGQASDVDLFGPLKARAFKNRETARAALSKDESLDQFAQIKACAQALAVAARPARHRRSLRATGIRPFTRKAHLNNPAIAIGDVRHEEFTLPLGSPSLLKYIQDYDSGERTLPAGAAPQPVRPPPDNDIDRATTAGTRDRDGGPGDPVVSIEGSSGGPTTTVAPGSAQPADSATELESAPDPPAAFPPPPIGTVRSDSSAPRSPADNGATPSPGSRLSPSSGVSANSAAGSGSTARSAFSNVSDSVRFTGLHLGRASAFAATASAAEVEDKQAELIAHFSEQEAMVQAKVAYAQNRMRNDLARVRRVRHPDALRARRAKAVSEARQEELKQLQSLQEQKIILEAKIQALQMTMEARLAAIEDQVAAEQEEFTQRTELDLMLRWENRANKLRRERDFCRNVRAELETCREDERRKVVSRAYGIFESTSWAHRDEFGITREKITARDGEYSSEASARLRARDNQAVETPVRASAGISQASAARSSASTSQVQPADSSSSSSSKRPLPPDSAASSTDRPASAKRPRQTSVNAAPFSNISEARGELRRLLEQKVPPIGQSKEVLRVIKSLLRKAKDPTWRQCVHVGNTFGIEFLSGATRILDSLDTLDADLA